MNNDNDTFSGSVPQREGPLSIGLAMTLMVAPVQSESVLGLLCLYLWREGGRVMDWTLPLLSRQAADKPGQGEEDTGPGEEGT